MVEFYSRLDSRQELKIIRPMNRGISIIFWGEAHMIQLVLSRPLQDQWDSETL